MCLAVCLSVYGGSIYHISAELILHKKRSSLTLTQLYVINLFYPGAPGEGKHILTRNYDIHQLLLAVLVRFVKTHIYSK